MSRKERQGKDTWRGGGEKGISVHLWHGAL